MLLLLLLLQSASLTVAARVANRCPHIAVS
jgi:hypothetical protein